MPRFFVGAEQISDKDIVITGTDVNHIRNVLRMTPGEEVTVSDGQGMDLSLSCRRRFICFRDCRRLTRWN